MPLYFVVCGVYLSLVVGAGFGGCWDIQHARRGKFVWVFFLCCFLLVGWGYHAGIEKE